MKLSRFYKEKHQLLEDINTYLKIKYINLRHIEGDLCIKNPIIRNIYKESTFSYNWKNISKMDENHSDFLI